MTEPGAEALSGDDLLNEVITPMPIFSWKSWRNPLASSRRTPKRRPLSSRRLELERLEDRLVLSAIPTAHTTYVLKLDQTGQPDASAGPTGFTPAQIQQAYGISQLYGIVGNGTGQTIAIVDAYDDPAFVNSTDPNFVNSDLHQFDLQFGLPDPPSFVKLNQTGGTSLPGTDPSAKPNDWEAEEALDVEWAHAIAPGANIILIECNSPGFVDLNTGVATAATLPGVSVVSMSFGGSEFNGETTQDSIYRTPAGHQGVTFLASTGDSGSPGGYPAYSPNVIAVGGTSLTLNGNNYGSESGWSGSGGGTSQFEPEPSFQQGFQNTGKRTIPDVAFVADPNTGVSVYDSYNNGAATPWWVVGGTSLAAPSWAGLIAIVNQGRAQRGEASLDGPSQTLPELYTIAKTNPSFFHDITTGSNGGFTAGPGYDEVTGLGSPAANLLIPALLGLTVQNTLSSAVEGQPLVNVPVANFNDPTGSHPASSYTVTIDWGDGTTSAGTVVADGGNNYSVFGSHTYINAGVVPLTVSVKGRELSGSDRTNVTVGDAPLQGSAQVVNGQVGSFVSNAVVAIFTDTDPTLRDASHYTATIQWSEGSGISASSNGSIVHLFGNTFEVIGSSPFTIPAGGLSPVVVVIRDVDGASVTVDSVLNAPHNPAIPPLVPMDQVDTGPATTQFVTMQDALTNLLRAEQLFMFALNFGSMDQKQSAFSNMLNAFFVYQADVFQFDMHLPGS